MPSPPTLVVMPRLGMTMREGRLVAWRVARGGAVARGGTLLVVESEKAEVEIAAPAGGFLRHVFAEEGVTVPCGAPLAALADSPDEPFDPDAFLAGLGRREEAPPEPRARREAAVPTFGGRRAGGAPVSPAARARARELGIDLGGLAGSGPGGRITREDVEGLAAALASRRRVAADCALEVRELGQGETALLLPGFGTDWTAFAKLLPGLSTGHRVLAVNPRGVGLSEAPGSLPLPVGGMAEDAAVLAGGGAHLVGASLGAAAALCAALARPERVRSLVLLAPVVVPGGRLRAVLEAWALLASRLDAEELAQALLPWLFSSRWLDDPERRARAAGGFAAMTARVPHDTLRRMVRGLADWPGFGRASVASLRVPTLVVTAGEDVLTPEAGRLADWIEGARRVDVAESGHALTLEAPERVESAIRQHWERVRGDRE